ncbi:hypothetical protein [Actinacidiphila sp. bgisy160]|uniref:hypothetical protein n=1 Tax=Actinacidiphila sp. bgisy160 TaxID=3413796 RepID=UPI003D757C2B
MGVHRDADLTHQRRRVDAVPLYVADDRCRRPRAVQADQVVEVAADVYAAGGREVAGGDAQAGHLRQGVRQQRLLEGACDLALGVVEPGTSTGVGISAGREREGFTAGLV